MNLDPARRAELLAAKLRALVKERWGEGERTPSTFPGGAALAEQNRGWVLADERAERSLGPALAWAAKNDITELHLLVERHAGLLARRAGEFVNPPTVWTVDGRTLTPAVAVPPLPAPPLPEHASTFADQLRAAGAEPVVEGGVLTGEVLGLEVARVISDEHGSYLEVGVGKHDREAQRLMHGDLPTVEALAKAVQAVADRRRPDAEPHPMNRLARERWLRALIVERPELVGAAWLTPVSSPVTKDHLRVGAPAPASGEDVDGNPVLVVCSVGIDLDLVPVAADARIADGRNPRLVLAMPARDDHPVTRTLAAALRRPAEIVPLDDDIWQHRP